MSTVKAEPVLARFLLGKTRAAVLALFYRDPSRSYYLRQVIKSAGGSPGSVQREVRLLLTAGLITQSRQGNQSFYTANRQSAVYEEIRSFLGKTMFGQRGDTRAGRNIFVPQEQIAGFCRKNHIRKLSFFGSVLRDDFRPDSDVDVLVEFEEGHVPGWDFFGMQGDLALILGRKVDMHTPGELKDRIKDIVVREAEVHYAT